MTPLRAAWAWITGLEPRTRRRALGTALVAALLALVALSMKAESTTTYSLRDTGVWVTQTSQSRVGRLNAQIAEIDFAAERDETILLQDGRHAYLVAVGDAGSVSQLDPADPMDDPTIVAVPGLDVAAVGGGVVATLSDGDLRILGRQGEMSGSSEPIAELGADALLTVGPGGTVAALTPSTGRLVTVRPGAGRESDTLDLSSSDVQLSMIGDRPVVLDVGASRLVVPDGDTVDLADRGGEPALQLSGPERGEVLVATRTSLLEVDLDDGSIDEVDDGGTGRPVPPAWDGTCSYAAWLGSGAPGRMAVDCGGAPLTEEITGGSWQLRTGGPTVVLNDPAEGVVVVRVDDDLVTVDQWPADETSQTLTPDVQPEPPDPLGDNDPVAVADVGEARMGARPGRTTFLQVLRNDWDPDGDLVFVDQLLTTDDRLQVAQGGRSISLDLSEAPPDQGGTIRFRYRISDGENTSEVVAVDVEIVTGEGRAPVLVHPESLATAVEVGRRVDHEVLTAFWDPDGDPIFLAEIDRPASDHQVDWTSDGWISFAAGNLTGTAVIQLTVKDTTNLSAPGALRVDVQAASPTSLPPVARNDFVTATVGTSVTIEPLANDVDPNDDELSLVDVELLRGVSDDLGDLDVADTTVTVRPQGVGDFVLVYTVSDGSAQAQTATATIVLRVTEQPTDGLDPVAIDDVVLVEVGRSAEVDLTRNDIDPLGRLLSVTAVREIEGEPRLDTVTYGLADDFRTFRVDTLPDATPDTLMTVQYEVSSGSGSATSTVTIVVVPAKTNRPPQPVVPAPVVAVRAGEVATVPLASFAWDPDGDPLSVHVSGPVATGDARPSGTSIRYFAPATAGGRRVTVPIEVREPSGTTQATSVVMDVIGTDGNSRPTALDLEARVRAGAEVVIPVPLLGLDPDGDPVRLLGRVGASAIRGEVVEDHGRQAFVYRATDGSFTGQDTFSYRVVDSLGAESREATVTVSVTSTDGNSAPVAVTDRAIVRVDGEVWVDATANDTDIDGDLIELVPSGLELLAGDCEVEAREGRVRVIAGEEAGDCTIAYQVVDVDPDLPGEPNHDPVAGRIVVRVLDEFVGTRPIARDDYAALEGDVESVRVEVLANDEDPDGLPSDLRVELIDPPAGVERDRRTNEVVVPVTAEPQLIRYRITDADDLTADAVIRVPGGGENRPPALVTPAPRTPSMRADGRPLEIDLTDHIFDPDGDDLAFSDISSASAVATTLSSRLADGIAVFDPLSEELAGLVTFQVTATDDAPEPLSRVFTITVRVEPRQNRPPDWKGSPCRPIEKGGAPTDIRLGAYVEDPDGDAVTFSGGGERNGVTVEITDDGSLRLLASADAVTGSTERFSLTVADPRGGEAETPCVVEVLPTSRPRIQATSTTATARQGETVAVDIRPLVIGAQGDVTIEAVTVETGAGGVERSGTTVRYTAPGDFSGDAVVRYTVSDELDDRANPRRASATITISVVGRPAPPQAVVAISEASRSVTVGWRNGDFNGSPVTSFRVRAVDGTVSATCSTSPCTLGAGDGIVNGHTYRFVVTAVNEVGESDPSAPSNEVTPNAVPGAPIGLTATVLPGDGSRTGRVEFSWSPGSNEGTALLEYVLSGAVNGGTGSTATSITVSGANGAELCLTVAARNAAGESSVSNRACATPFGRPIVAVTGVTATGRGEGTVTWTVDGNGRAITAQTVTGCPTTPATIAPTTRTVTISCGTNINPTITITATNEGGARGEATTQPSLYAPPQIIGGFTISGRRDAVRIESLPAVNPFGRPVTHFDYRLAGGAWARLPDERIVAAPAWEWTTVELRACNSDASCSDPRASDEPAMAYGTPAAPTDLVAVRQTGQTDNVEVSFAFAAPADLGPWELTYLVEWGEGATAGTSSGTLGAERLIILTGVAPPAQTGTLQICVRGTSACSSAPFDIPAATP